MYLEVRWYVSPFSLTKFKLFLMVEKVICSSETILQLCITIISLLRGSLSYTTTSTELGVYLFRGPYLYDVRI